MSFRHILYQPPVPADVGESLKGLYQSAFCVPEYFQLYRNVNEAHAIVIFSNGTDPEHVIFFTISGREAIILNEFFEIGDAYLNYLAKVLFKKNPKIKVIHCNKLRRKMENLSFPYEVWRVIKESTVELPGNMSEYRRLLGKRTKANMNNYRNKLVKNFDDFCFSVKEGIDIDAGDINKIIEFNRSRMVSKSAFSAIDTALEEKIIEFSRSYGIVATIKLNGGMAAGTICYRVGDHCYADVIAHDQAYNKYSIGRVCIYLFIEALIARGVHFFHMGGEDEYKKRMLGIPQDLYCLSMFRNKVYAAWGRIRHIRRYESLNAYEKMIRYNYFWRLRDALMKKISSD